VKLSPFLRELDFITGDIENFSCPYCGSGDRERHLVLFFDKLGLWQAFEGATVLHFAPEVGLKTRIEAREPREYVKADLFSDQPGIAKIDVMDIPFPDHRFDFILCCHVLEHVPDDRRAMTELHRVLKPGGRGVLQTPFSRFLTHTFEDPNINTEPLRRRYYGQEDHVRLYGRDLLDKLEAAGFTLDLKSHSEYFNAEETRRFGVCAKEDLILVSKNPGTDTRTGLSG
jgi:SAM-dependent methyltransferase